jgi:hypothetical protein
VILWELHRRSAQECDSKAFAEDGSSRGTPGGYLTRLLLRT